MEYYWRIFCFLFLDRCNAYFDGAIDDNPRDTEEKHHMIGNNESTCYPCQQLQNIGICQILGQLGRLNALLLQILPLSG
jgi:hypothetical protein